MADQISPVTKPRRGAVSEWTRRSVSLGTPLQFLSDDGNLDDSAGESIFSVQTYCCQFDFGQCR